MGASLTRRGTWIVSVALLLSGALLLLLLLPRRSRVLVREVASSDLAAAERLASPLAAPANVARVAPSRAERQEVDAVSRAPSTISGVVLGPNGAPIEGAACSIRRGRVPLGLDSLLAGTDDPESASSDEVRTLSDHQGQFQLEAPSGFWLLRVQAEGARPFEEDHLRPGAFRWVRLETAIELSVRVLDSAGAPIRGARLELLASEYSPSALAVARAETGAGGVASLSVPSGQWTLAARHPEHRPHFELLKVPPGSARVDATIVLSPGIRVFGRVSARGRSAPPTGTRVAIDSILGFQESLELACAADGSFSSGHTFSAGQVLEVAATAPGFGEVRREVDLQSFPAVEEAAEEEAEVEVHLTLERRERSAAGRVVDAQAEGLARVAVFVKPLLALPREAETELPDIDRLAELELEVEDEPLESYQAQWCRVTRTDSRGEFRVVGLDYRRPYSLLLVSPRHGNARLWIEAGDSAGEVDLGTTVLRAGGRIFGVVRARDGSSVASLPVSTVWLNRVQLRSGTTFKNQRPSALTEGFQTTTNLDGEFALEPLPEGEFFLHVAEEPFGPFSLVSGESRGPEVLEIGRDPRLGDEASAISGRVVDENGLPIEGCFVQLFHEKSGGSIELLAATSVDPEGRFELPARPPGPFLFKALDIADRFLGEIIRFESAGDWRPRDVVLFPNPNAGPALTGRVLGPSGEGLPSMKVTLHVSPSVTACSCVARSLSTDPSGGFDFGPLAVGAHRVVVVDPEGRFRPQGRFPVHAGDFLELTLDE